MAIARRRTNKKNNIRRKSRAVVKRGGARKMTQKGGMEEGSREEGGMEEGGMEEGQPGRKKMRAEDLCDGLAKLEVPIDRKPTRTVCYDKGISAGLGEGLKMGGLLGAHSGGLELVKEFVELVYKDSPKSIYTKTSKASGTAQIPDQVYEPLELQAKYLHPTGGTAPQIAREFVLWDSRRQKPMNYHYFPNALNLAREVSSLYDDSEGVNYVPADFQRQIAPYLSEIQRGSNVKGVLEAYAKTKATDARDVSQSFIMKMFNIVSKNIKDFWQNVKTDRETQIEVAKLTFTIAGMVYGGTIGTAFSATVGLSSRAARLFFNSATTLGSVGLSALLSGVGLSLTTYGAIIYLMFGLPLVPNIVIAAALYSVKVRYPTLADPEQLKAYLIQVFTILGITEEIDRLRTYLDQTGIIDNILRAVQHARNFKEFYDNLATSAVLPIVDGLRFLIPKIKAERFINAK